MIVSRVRVARTVGVLVAMVAIQATIACSAESPPPPATAPVTTVSTESTTPAATPANAQTPEVAVDEDLAAILVGNLVGVALLPEDVGAGRFSDYLVMDFEYRNTSNRAIRAVTGVAVFNDLFDREIRRIGLMFDEPIGPGETVADSGRSLQLNQFRDEDNQLKNKTIDQINFHFEVEAILWDDGSISGEVSRAFVPPSGPAREELRAIVEVALEGIVLVPEDFRAGRFSDSLGFAFRYTNHSDNDVRAFTGQAVFLDLFGREIKRLSLTYDTLIAAGETVLDDDKAFELNQFRDEDQALASTALEDLQFAFVVDSILFVDGTRLGQ